MRVNPPEKTRTTRAKRGRPIADKLVKKMHRHVRAKVVDLEAVMIGRKDAEEQYLPSGPPMSPLTPSFFTCWAFFDADVGMAEETIGTTTIAVGSACGMDEDLVRVIGLMQESRMAVYAHQGTDGDRVVLRELVTNRVCKAICPSGYRGRRIFLRGLPDLPESRPHSSMNRR